MASCTRSASLAAIAKVLCAVHFDQIAALALQRTQATPSFATEAEIKTLAAWTPLLTAAGNTKVVKTPEFADFTVPGSEPQFEGQNTNATIGGLGYFAGLNAVQPKGNFYGLPSDVRTQLSLLQDESAPGLDPGLTAYFLLTDGRIVYSKDPTTGNIGGIPITNFYVGSLDLGGLRALNKNGFGFSLAGDWDKNIQVVQPSFNARQALAGV
ncbi:hypothetical protein [Hymenobacter nivis]|uniref:Uncharacterized protein n=1 Tax=Hymenobacter nivis TaxID=1850093 RepID=A0A502GXI2_9BACT|nr:hypothetical protein [Hymenobacter nivis]TPG66078.1 hypothetical protein EAH73_11960 [Hymenobacter nivis]